MFLYVIYMIFDVFSSYFLSRRPSLRQRRSLIWRRKGPPSFRRNCLYRQYIWFFTHKSYFLSNVSPLHRDSWKLQNILNETSWQNNHFVRNKSSISQNDKTVDDLKILLGWWSFATLGASQAKQWLFLPCRPKAGDSSSDEEAKEVSAASCQERLPPGDGQQHPSPCAYRKSLRLSSDQIVSASRHIIDKRYYPSPITFSFIKMHLNDFFFLIQLSGG